MKCPVDNATLSMMDKQGVEIDYCPECRGVWLNRGELDKIIDANGKSTNNNESYTQQHQQPPRHHDNHYNNGHHYKKKKNENFLSDLFDF